MFDDVVSDRAQRGAKPSGLVTCVRNGGNHQGQTEMLCKSHALYTVHPDLLIVLLVHVDSPGGLENSLFLLELFFWKRRKSWNFRFRFEGFATHCSVYGHFLLVHGAGWFWGCTGWFNENHHTLVLSMMWIHGVKRQWWWWWWSSLLPPSLITTIKYMYIYINIHYYCYYDRYYPFSFRYSLPWSVTWLENPPFSSMSFPANYPPPCSGSGISSCLPCLISRGYDSCRCIVLVHVSQVSPLVAGSCICGLCGLYRLLLCFYNSDSSMMFGDIPTTQPWERDRIFALVPRPDAGDLGYWQWQHIQTVSGDDSLTFWWAKTC